MWRAERLRRTLRGKLQRAVAEAVRADHDELNRSLQLLSQEVAAIKDGTSGRIVALGDRLSEEIRLSEERVNDRMSAFEIRSRRNVLCAAEALAAQQSAAFAGEHLSGARQFGHPHATLDYALSLAPTDGMALEFGVYTGITLQRIAAARNGRSVYGFDSFQGLPEHWRPGFPAGTFATDSRPQIPGAELVPGWFDDVLPAFLRAHPDPVDLLHIDADLYSSAKSVLDLLGPRLGPGTVVVFDEYFNYPGWQQHEHRAWMEFSKRTHTTFRYEAFTADNEQIVVSITSRPQHG